LKVQDYLIKDFLDPEVLRTTINGVLARMETYSPVVIPGTGAVDDSDGELNDLFLSVLEKGGNGSFFEKLEERGISSRRFVLLAGIVSGNKSARSRETVSLITEKLRADSGCTAVVSTGGGGFVVLQPADGSSVLPADLAVGIIRFAQKETGNIPTMSLSDSFGPEDSLADVYRQVLDLLEYRIFLGHGRVIQSETVDSLIWMNPEDRKKIIREIRQALMVGDRKSFSEKLKELYSINASGMIQYNYLEYVNLKLVSLLIQYIDDNHLNEEFEPDFSEIRRLETVVEIHDWFRNNFDQAFELSELPEKKGAYNVHVRKALEIIENGYADDLSLDHIAEKLNLHKVYLGRVFKKATGKTCYDYIQHVRIEKAKELLLTTSLSMAQIAAQTGFTSYDHFASVFRKRTDITPSSFRKRL
jgi:AraC-like DNA-binding protein